MNYTVYIDKIFFFFIESIIILSLYAKLSNIKIYDYKIILHKFMIFPVLYTIVSFWANIYFPFWLYTLSRLIFMIVTLTLLTSTAASITSTISVMILVLLLMTESLARCIINFLLRMDLIAIMDDRIYALVCSSIAKGLQILAVVVVHKSKLFNNKLYFIFRKENNISRLFTLQTICMGTLIFIYNYRFSLNDNLGLYNILLVLIFILFLVIRYYLLNEINQLINIQNKYKVQDEYLQNIETILNIIRKEKHDFCNHLNTLYAMCTVNRPNTLEHIKKYILSLDNNLKSSYHFYNTGNEYVDGLLAVKSNRAYVNGIHFDVDFEVPLSLINVEDHALVSILSNIIDNAFDALSRQPEQEKAKIISIITYIDNEKYHISISNSGPMIPPENICKIFDKGFSTKAFDKHEHGFGLYIVKQLVNQYNGDITVESTEQETEFIITFDLNINRADRYF